MDAKRSIEPLTAVALALLVAVAGCADTDPPSGPTPLSAWEATLAPVLSTTPDTSTVLITGNVAALVRESGTEVGVGIEPFETADLTLDWGLHHGQCDLPGDLLGEPADYPQLSASGLEATAILDVQLVEGDAYYVALTDAESGGTLACGNLSQTEL